MRVNSKHEQKITLTIMVLIMTFIVTFIGTAKNIGFVDEFVSHWLKAWGFAFFIALPTVMLIMPSIRKFVSKIIYDESNENQGKYVS